MAVTIENISGAEFVQCHCNVRTHDLLYSPWIHISVARRHGQDETNKASPETAYVYYQLFDLNILGGWIFYL